MLVLATIGCIPAAAHDFWIEPSSFRPDPGSAISARLFVGEHFRGDPYPRNERHVLRFFLKGPGGEAPLAGLQGEDPAGVAEIDAPGLHWVAYASRETAVELDPDKLGTYIGEVGLEPFFDADRTKPIRDHFWRCAKALLLSGPARAGLKGFDRPLGLRLELIPELNPYALGKDAVLPVRLLQAGNPVANALVVAIEKSRPQASAVRARTDAQGRVRLALPVPGIWLIKAVWIAPVVGKSGEWESWWASLSFELPAFPASPFEPHAPTVSAPP